MDNKIITCSQSEAIKILLSELNCALQMPKTEGRRWAFQVIKEFNSRKKVPPAATIIKAILRSKLRTKQNELLSLIWER